MCESFSSAMRYQAKVGRDVPHQVVTSDRQNILKQPRIGLYQAADDIFMTDQRVSVCPHFRTDYEIRRLRQEARRAKDFSRCEPVQVNLGAIRGEEEESGGTSQQQIETVRGITLVSNDGFVGEVSVRPGC